MTLSQTCHSISNGDSEVINDFECLKGTFNYNKFDYHNKLIELPTRIYLSSGRVASNIVDLFDLIDLDTL